MPFPAALPIPTINAMGVASPRVQGQAIMMTATAAVRAWKERGSGPAIIQTTKVTMLIPITIGTKMEATRSASC